MRKLDLWLYKWYNWHLHEGSQELKIRKNILGRIESAYDSKSKIANPLGTALYIVGLMPEERDLRPDEGASIINENFTRSDKPSVGGLVLWEWPMGEPIGIMHLGVITRTNPLRITSRISKGLGVVIDSEFKKSSLYGHKVSEVKFYTRK